RAALHDQHTREVRADDAILLRLDGRDDVVHAAGAFGPERREQGALPLVAAALRQEFGVEDLVLDAHDLAAAGDEVASRPRPQGRRRSRLVEGARLRHTPVEQDGALLLIAQADAADVTARRVIRI